MVDDWGLGEKVEAMAIDNAYNMVNAVAKVGWRHVPCFGQSIQLAVKAGLQLPAVAQVTARCRKVVGHFSHSCNAQNALAVKQVQLEVPQHKLIQEVPTRWNSTYEMMKRLLEQRTAVSAVLLGSKRATTRELNLSPSELTQMELLVQILEPLAQATEMLSTDGYPSLSVMQPLLASLLKKQLKSTDQDAKLVVDMKQAISEKLHRRFSSELQHKFMLLATVLDPRFKMLKFLSTADRNNVYAELSTVAIEIADAEDEVPTSPKKKLKLSDVLQLMDYQESSESRGSSPADGSGIYSRAGNHTVQS